MDFHDHSERLVDLARQMDNELRDKSGAFPVLRNESLSDSDSNAPDADLSDQDKKELEEARAALRFLNRIKSDFQKTPERKDTTGQQTYGGESTLRDHQHDTDRNGQASNGHRFNGASHEDKPTKMGRFEILEEIGVGGFAKVYRALDPQLGREVALKVPKPQVLVSSDARKRFRREARTAAVLSHPAIVPLFETGTIGPITYIASEYCPGTDLAHWFSECDRKTDARTAASIIAALAEAVQHAHRRDVIHRDLKPANVLVVDGDKPIEKRLRVTDFGLARNPENDEQYLTQEGAVIGTPAYMAPEQARGSNDIGHAADIFSLGVILYELLTGTLPFKRGNQIATMMAIENERPESPRRRNPMVSRDLEAICLKCLEKDPAHRYENALALSEDLFNWLDGRRVTARHTSPAERFVRWVKREPRLAAAVCFGMASLAIGLVLTAWQWSIARENLKSSNLQKQRAFRNLSLLTGTIDETLDIYNVRLESDGKLTDSERQVLEKLIAVHKRLIDDEAQEVEVTPEMMESYTRIARIYREMGDFDKSRQVCDQGDVLFELAKANKQDNLVELTAAYAMFLGQDINLSLTLGDHGRAVSKCNEALKLTEASKQALNEGELLFQNFYFRRHLGLALHSIGKYAESLKQHQIGMELAKQLFAVEPTNEDYNEGYARAYQDLARASRNLAGEEEKIVGLLQHSLEIIQAMEENEDFDGDYRYRIAYLNYEIGDRFRSSKDYEMAAKLIDESMKMLKTLTEEDPENAVYFDRYGMGLYRKILLLQSTEKYQELVDLCESSIFEIFDKVRSPKTRCELIGYGTLRYVDALRSLKADDQKIVDACDKVISTCIQAEAEFPNVRSFPLLLAELNRHRGISTYYLNDQKNQFAYPYYEKSCQAAFRALKLDPANGYGFAMNRLAFYSSLNIGYGHFQKSRDAILEVSNILADSGKGQFECAALACLVIEGMEADENASPDLLDQLNKEAKLYAANADRLGIDLEPGLNSIKQDRVSDTLRALVTDIVDEGLWVYRDTCLRLTPRCPPCLSVSPES